MRCDDHDDGLGRLHGDPPDVEVGVIIRKLRRHISGGAILYLPDGSFSRRDERNRMRRRLKFGMTVIVVALIAATGLVFAGDRQVFTTKIDLINRTAEGSLSDTYNNGNIFEFMECGTIGGMGHCLSRTEDQVYAGCTTTDPELMSVIRSMNSESRIIVKWDAASVCTYVASYASSRANPRQP